MKQLNKRDLNQVAGAGKKPSYEFETVVAPDGSIIFKFKGWSFTVTSEGGRVFEFE